jgi:hypothetical protein
MKHSESVYVPENTELLGGCALGRPLTFTSPCANTLACLRCVNKVEQQGHKYHGGGDFEWERWHGGNP